MENTSGSSIRTGQTLAASLFLSAALAFAAVGCGEQKQAATADTGAGGTTTVSASEPARTPVGDAVPASATGAAETVAPSDGSLPPDVAAAGPEEIVMPGSVVTITALGSADVTSVTMTDATGEKTPFTFDSEANLWRASYRVPVRIREDRIGLSVTASTDANRWKRVWVFLRTREEAAADSTR